MARPLKDGLTYYSHYTDMSSDPKILCLEAKHGLQGYAVYNKLLEIIFSSSNGEIDFSQDITPSVLAKKFGISVKSFQNILNSCLIFKLFDDNLYKSQKVLSSNGIKKRFTSVIAERERKRNWKEKHDKSDTNDKNSSDVVDGDNSGTSKDIDTTRQGYSDVVDGESTHRIGKDSIGEDRIGNNIYITEGQAPQIVTLEDFKNNMEKASNKIGYLGYVFQLLHKSCPKEFTDNIYGRLGKLVKNHNDDYHLILSAIYKTQDGVTLIQGNHLDYIDKFLKNNKNNGHKPEIKRIEDGEVTPGNAFAESAKLKQADSNPSQI
jgi:hypothetical protein